MLVAVFLLPWQSRWIYQDLTINGSSWEYGRLSLYAVELLILLAFVLRGRPRVAPNLSPFVRCAVLFCGTLLVSASFSQNATLALASLPHFFSATALFLLLIDERTNLRHAAWAFVAGLSIPCTLAWYQVVSGTSPVSSWLGLAPHDAATLGQSVVETVSGRMLRGYGTFPHPNVFGGYLAVGLIALTWLTRGIRTRGTRLMVAALACLLASTLIITFSRSAWLGAAVGFALLAGMTIWTRRTVSRRAVLFVSFILTTMLLTTVAFHSAAFTRLGALDGQTGSRLEARSIEERIGSYAGFRDIFLMNAIMGVGPGNDTAALATIYPGREAWSYQPVHNAILLAFAEIGLILLFPIIRFLITFVRLVRMNTSSTGALIALSLLIVLFPIALLDHYLWSLWPGMAVASFTIGFSMRAILDT
jgi:O-antigen ligase